MICDWHIAMGNNGNKWTNKRWTIGTCSWTKAKKTACMLTRAQCLSPFKIHILFKRLSVWMGEKKQRRKTKHTRKKLAMQIEMNEYSAKLQTPFMCVHFFPPNTFHCTIYAEPKTELKRVIHTHTHNDIYFVRWNNKRIINYGNRFQNRWIYEPKLFFLNNWNLLHSFIWF